MDDEFKKHFRKLEARVVRRADQELQVIKSVYVKFSEEEKEQFRTWIAKLVDLADHQPPCTAMDVIVRARNVFQDQSGEERYEENASLSPGVILKALQAWDRGEEFAPGLFSLC